MNLSISVEGATSSTADATPTRVVATYPTYQEAQRAIDLLSYSAFPVEHATIVGRDLRLVERISGRVTRSRSTLMGAASGAWWGLFVGALVGLFLPVPEWVLAIATGVLFGAIAGALFGLSTQWAMPGQRDFASESGVVADRYDVTVTNEHSQRASELLSRSVGSWARSAD